MSNLTLYQIEDALMQLIEMREDPTLQPDERAAADKALEEYLAAEVEKVDNIRGLLRHSKLMAAASREEARDFERKARMWEATEARVKEICARALELAGKQRFEGRTGAIKFKGNGGVQPLQVTDLEQVPDDMCKYVGWIRGDTWKEIRKQYEGVIEAGTDFALERQVFDGLVRAGIERDGGVPGAYLGERGKHIEIA